MKTRVAADAEGFHAFHREVLPQRIATGNGELAHGDLHSLGTLAIRTPAGSYTFLPTTSASGSGTVEVVEGHEVADTVVELELDAWHGLINDLDTSPGLFYGGRATVPIGNPMRFIRWEPGLRCLFHGIPIFDPDTADLRNIDGSPLDPTRTFAMAELSTDESLRMEATQFISTAGYLVVKGVFTEPEVEAFRKGVDRAEEQATPGDQKSWWGRNDAGEEVLTRVLNAHQQAELAGVPSDPRVAALAALAPEDLSPRTSGGVQTASVLWKRKNVAEGLSDLPWHRDCGMGGHAINCPAMVMSICLTSGTPGAGELRVLPGSHKGSYPFVDGRDVHAPTGVPLDVGPGDLSLHYGDVMHASLTPTDETTPERISLLVALVAPDHGNHLGRGHYNDVLLGNPDGQIEHLADKLGYDKYEPSVR
jgi:ectoine hydroxylase-related dioxygenase (phytanoyl-CoA dioxygenase family)